MPYKDPQNQRAAEKRYKERHAQKIKERNKQYGLNHKVEIRKARVKRVYGLTIEQYDYILVSQNYRCAICGNLANAKKRLAIDHDHATGRVRGLLCSWCNTRLEKFQRYLERPEPLGKPIFVPLKKGLDKTSESE